MIGLIISLLVVGLIAALEVGGIAVPINPMNTTRELRYQLEDSGARVLVTIPSLYRAVAQDVVGDTAVVLTVVGGHTQWTQQGEEVEISEARVGEELGADVLSAESIFSQEGREESVPPDIPAEDIADPT